MRVTRITTAVAAIGLCAVLSAGAVASGKPSARATRMAAPNGHSTLTADIASARLATAQYSTNLARAKAVGYQ